MVCLDKNPASHGPSLRLCKPTAPSFSLSGRPQGRPRPPTPGPGMYVAQDVWGRRPLLSRQRSAPAIDFRERHTALPPAPEPRLRCTTEFICKVRSCFGPQRLSTVANSRSVDISHSKRHPRTRIRKTPSPADYSTVNIGFCNSPTLKHAPAIGFAKSERDPWKGTHIPGADRYDPASCLHITRAATPSHTMGRRHEAPEPYPGSHESFRMDVALGHQFSSLRRTMPSINFGSSGRNVKPTPGLVGWSPVSPGPGAYG